MIHDLVLLLTYTDTKENEHIIDRGLVMSLDAQQTILDEMGVTGLDKIRGNPLTLI